MKNIRKILKDKKNQQRKQSNTLVIHRISNQNTIPKTIQIHNQKIIKFSWDHWIYEQSLLEQNLKKQSRFFQNLSYFKSISHAKKIQNCVVFFIKKQNKHNDHIKLQYFIQKYQKNQETASFSHMLDRIQNLENQIRKSHLTQKKQNIGPFSKVSNQLIHALFIKSLKNFKNPFLALGYNLDFDTMKPYLESIAFSNSILSLLQRDADEFMIQCLQNNVIPDIFTNYGFKQWNQLELGMIQNILSNILSGNKNRTQKNPFQESVRQLVDAYQNKIKVQIKSSFQIPILASFQILNIVGLEQFNILKRKSEQSLNGNNIRKILYLNEQYQQYLKNHTASFREVDKSQSKKDKLTQQEMMKRRNY